jgi:hypothetical protein
MNNDKLLHQASALTVALQERINDIEGDYYAEYRELTTTDRAYIARMRAVLNRAIARLVRRGGDDPYAAYAAESEQYK